MHLRIGLLILVLTGSAAAAPTAASKAACLAAHEQAQSLRTQKKLHAARDKFVACAKPECPVVLQKECSDQIEQMESVAPTVTLEALDDKGASDADVKVTLDGQPLVEKLTGAAIPVEPGEHTFHFQRAKDSKAIDLKVMIGEGEKNRKVVADYQTLVPKPKGTDTNAIVTTTASEPKKIPPLAFVAGGVAIVGLGSFGVFSLLGRGEESSLADRCSPRCTDDEVSPVKRDYLIADISLAIGIVAAAAAVILALPAFTSSSSKSAAAR